MDWAVSRGKNLSQCIHPYHLLEPLEVALQPRHELRLFLDGLDQERNQLLVVDRLEAGVSVMTASGRTASTSWAMTPT